MLMLLRDGMRGCMKRDGRRQAIMDMLVNVRSVTLDNLADHFAVSRMTIHRDLENLEQAGLLRKVRGGATIEAGARFESDFRIRAMQDAGGKARMARAALALVEPGMTLLVNDGSTAALLGRGLVEKRPLTVITNNAAILDHLRDQPGMTLIALGGTYSAKYNAFFGGITEHAECADTTGRLLRRQRAWPIADRLDPRGAAVADEGEDAIEVPEPCDRALEAMF